MVLAIKNYREAAKMTQSDLAKKINVGRTVVANWETGVSLPRADMLPKLATALGCTVNDLYRTDTENTA